MFADFDAAANVVLDRFPEVALIPLTALNLIVPDVLPYKRAHELKASTRDHYDELEKARAMGDGGGSTLVDGVSAVPYVATIHDTLLQSKPLLTWKRTTTGRADGNWQFHSVDTGSACGRLITSTGLKYHAFEQYMKTTSDQIRSGAEKVVAELSSDGASWFERVLRKAKGKKCASLVYTFLSEFLMICPD